MCPASSERDGDTPGRDPEQKNGEHRIGNLAVYPQSCSGAILRLLVQRTVLRWPSVSKHQDSKARKAVRVWVRGAQVVQICCTEIWRINRNLCVRRGSVGYAHGLRFGNMKDRTRRIVHAASYAEGESAWRLREQRDYAYFIDPSRAHDAIRYSNRGNNIVLESDVEDRSAESNVITSEASELESSKLIPWVTAWAQIEITDQPKNTGNLWIVSGQFQVFDPNFTDQNLTHIWYKATDL
ncbi:hypothetical protein C8R45DRAFT_944553 [Mycena sanguinolenta]|nr:hypothetical protein C8R45DRAFT_944553 [Mycena sanguinolenta]